MFCEVCHGAGKIVTVVMVARPPIDWVECPDEVVTCPECSGSGYQKDDQPLLEVVEELRAVTREHGVKLDWNDEALRRD